MRKFEIVQAYKDKGIILPERGTDKAAGYDLRAAEDILIPSFIENNSIANYLLNYKEETLLEAKKINKEMKHKAVLIPTGIKIYCEPDEYIAIVPRSSVASNMNLIIPNSPGTIDADYVDNPDNEGHCYVPMINLNNYPVKIKKGERIAQAIFQKYLTVDDDKSEAKRTGGFGSTGTK